MTNHHETLRAALDWSYDLLTPTEQALLRRLAVFSGGFTLSASETVCAGDGIEPQLILDTLSSLVDKSLVGAHTLGAGEARYFLLETVRQYLRPLLQIDGTFSSIKQRHLEHFLELAEDASARLRGEEQQLWLGRLDAEQDNIRAALAWSCQSRHAEPGLRLAIALYEFWVIRSHVQEGSSWLARLLDEADESVSPVLRANALAYAGFLAGIWGDTASQADYGRKAAVLAESAGDEGKRALAWALGCLAWATRATGDHQREFDLARRQIEVTRELSDRHLLGVTLIVWSPTAMALGRYDEAQSMLQEGLALVRDVGDGYRIAMALNYQGDLARCRQEYAAARPLPAPL